jgi:hypothetical protein
MPSLNFLVMVFASNEETAAMRIHNTYADENGDP